MSKPWPPVIVAALIVALAACGGKGGGGTMLTPPPVLPQMGGSWDFTVSGGNGNPVGLEVFLDQDTLGNLSANTTISSLGGPGQSTNGVVFEVDIFGSSLSTTTDMAVDYVGNTCAADNGTRRLTGTINVSGQVALAYEVGGSATVTIDGAFSASATPPFSGSFTVSAPGCKSDGETGTVTGQLASSLTGTYSGTNASDSTDTITLTLTETNNIPCCDISGTGTDSKKGNFTVQGVTVGNFGEGNFGGAGSPVGNSAAFGYFDPQLGVKGSVLLTSFQGGNATTCPNGVPINNGSCLIAILALQ
jgi:hypothetical protein